MADSQSLRQIELHWTEPSGERRSQPADVVSMERNSLRLAVREAISFGQKCELSFCERAEDADLAAAATVRDVRPQPREGFRITCQFDAPLSEALLRALTDSGHHNRRAHERRPVSLEINALPELAQGQGQFAVKIVDLSPGGCCLASPQQIPIGYRIRLSADRDAQPDAVIPLRVQWQKRDEQQFLVGCSFVSATGYQRLAPQVYDDAASGGGKSGRRLIDRMFFLALGAVGLGATAGATAQG
jgi:hypothetical protein